MSHQSNASPRLSRRTVLALAAGVAMMNANPVEGALSNPPRAAKPDNPTGPDFIALAQQHGGSVVVLDVPESEREWSRGYLTVYDFFTGLFITNFQLRLLKPTVFIDSSSWSPVELTADQQAAVDQEWERYMDFNDFIDWEWSVMHPKK